MTEADPRSLSTSRKRRGVIRASLTRLRTRLSELESATSRPSTQDAAKRLMTKLEALDKDFKVHHFAIVDLTDDEEALQGEQEALDSHDDDVAQLGTRIQQLITACSPTSDASPRKIPFKRLSRLQKVLTAISGSMASLPTDSDSICLLHQHEEQLSEFKLELSDIRNGLFSLDLEDTDELSRLLAAVEKSIFDCSLEVKKLLVSHTLPKSNPDDKGVKLPKLSVPTFDGNLLNWKSFWEQFDVSVHSKTKLSNAEKLVYLQHALKDGTAKRVIEGLSRSGEHYTEAVECLQSRYNRPRLIHQTHVRMIIEAPGLKEGTGKELRRLHDTVQQHLRALKSLGHEPPGSFITSLLELKLDENTTFEWQRHSQASVDVPHYKELLEFINLRAQASESSSMAEPNRKLIKNETPHGRKNIPAGRSVATFATSTDVTVGNCIVCKRERHPLYACAKFRALSHSNMVATLKSNGLCLNCLRPGHFVKDCSSLHRCKRCQKPHHTLLHIESKGEPTPTDPPPTTPISTNATMGLQSNLLLMTCCIVVEGPDGSTTQARAILDSASSASFISECLAQRLHLPRSKQSTRISGVAGLSCNSSAQSITGFKVSSLHSPSKKFGVSAVIVSRVTCDLPLHPISFNARWDHLSGLKLADPDFGVPGGIDLLLGVEVFVEVMCNGRRSGSPAAFETEFGWVLAGSANSCTLTHMATVYHASLLTGDDLIRRFWEVEERVTTDHFLTPEERTAHDHFKTHHAHLSDGRFIVPLPRKPSVQPLGESRSQAVRRFLSFERSLHSKGHFQEFEAVIAEYFKMGHAEEVPEADLEKSPQDVFYLPMHSVRKESSTTTKVRAVFDASAKTSTGVSLNDTLLVGPTVHTSLVDVLLRFRLHRVALTADVSKMYRAIALVQSERDLHRFVWRSTQQDPLKDFRMTRVTFGVSASSFVANMCIKQNALDHALEYPLAAKAVDEAFYVDDGVTGADHIEGAIELHHQLHALFSKAGFLLRKWNSSEPAVLQHIDPELRDSQSVRPISDPESEYTKTLGIEWHAGLDHFRLTVADLPPLESVTKRALVSDIAKTFDVLGWFSPAIVTVKILLQRLWEEKVPWDDPVPPHTHQAWSQWRSELHLLSDHHIPRCYFPREVKIVSMQLHGFSDASELAYAGVVYLRMIDVNGGLHTSLIMSKTKVAPIKRLTIPRLELCGAHLLAQLLHHCKEVFHLPSTDVFAWTDSTIVLNWLVGNPRRFKTYVGNRTSLIVELIAPERWGHVEGIENPADCASRGMFPSELLLHGLWWIGPSWLQLDTAEWPKQPELAPNTPSDEGSEVCLHTAVSQADPVVPIDLFSSFTRLKRVTAWVLRFVHNCQAHKRNRSLAVRPLTVHELELAESYWVSLSQRAHFASEIGALKAKAGIPRSSPLLSLNPFLDGSSLLRVGGREQNSKLPYCSQHPLIVHAKYPLSRLIIRSEHLRLLHAGPTLLAASLSRRFHFIGGRSIIRSITRSCVTCRYKSSRPQPQMMGQLPMERVTPDSVFSNVGVDYAGPVYLKLGTVRKPTIIKSYVAVFVSFSVKAVHLELVSDLTAEAFLACLRRFIARRGKPTRIWSDHGTNFVGAARLIKELFQFLRQRETEETISNFCTSQKITWDFIPERAPHFGGLWESAVKSMKTHLSRIVGNVKLTFEELTTVLAQIEACLNSRPLVPLTCDDDGVEALTPGHFLIGRPLEALPDPAFSYRSISLLRRWHLCQSLVRHFWHRWSSEYLSSLQKFHKWHHPSKNIAVGDVVVMREDGLVPARWPIARVIKTHAGQDGLVRVVTVKTSKGTYTRPVTKTAVLLPCES